MDDNLPVRRLLDEMGLEIYLTDDRERRDVLKKDIQLHSSKGRYLLPMACVKCIVNPRPGGAPSHLRHSGVRPPKMTAPNSKTKWDRKMQ